MMRKIPKYVEPLFRPPAEANSLIFQVAHGCPHNSCRFCGMYKGVRYHERSEDEVLREFAAVAASCPDETRIFLADGDVMHLPFERLRKYLETLNRCFPALARVNSYANASSILSKTQEQLQELRRLKLNTLYLGLESGSSTVLDMVKKQETPQSMIEAVQLAQSCGFTCSVMILLGLGGKKYRDEHITRTIEVLNAMQPRLLSALRFIPVPNTVMPNEYAEVSEHEGVDELCQIIAGLELRRTVFRSNHSSNPVPLAGRFPADKTKMLSELDFLLKSNRLDRSGPGMKPLYL
ncbi:MAG: radical SAM protein [Victivallaceae bacterium]|nr:radical SAM protein [Victivallaceae bacterium]